MGGERLARILVLDGHSPATLAFVRSLAGRPLAGGRRGGGARGTGLAVALLQIALAVSSPSPGGDAIRGVDRAFARESQVDLILPMTDATTWPLASHSDRFSGIGHLGLSDPRCRGTIVR